ncbi:capsule assembly Wzi family protein [Vibrio sp. 03-59-1]|uniref:hypothetical protein n=1 Tax=Vibrio sp. 03-59-1 TaxID=2607607 RepID=UPI0014937668|nr:hypothetical protein [Vibrio sp. 03-59-1]NOH84565.1 capsule assembly Wzi family protein [Vibrio sp. 03-59-1]
MKISYIHKVNGCLIKWVGTLSLLIAHTSSASPWLEANDPVLKGHLQVLVDSGVLTTSTNTYPIRWTLLSEELGNVDVNELSAIQRLSFRYLKHSYDVQRVGRGLYGGHLSWNSKERSHVGFGDRSSRFKWNTEFQTASNGKYSAYRINAGYGEAWSEGESKFHMENSFFVLGDGVWQLSLSQLDKWWGNGWANSVSWSQGGTPLKTLNAAYIVDIEPLNDIWVETNISELEQPYGADYLWSSRMATKVQFVEIGLSSQYAFDGDEHFQGSHSTDGIFFDKDIRNTIDLKLSLPTILGIYSSVYGSFSHHKSKAHNNSDVFLYGVDAQWSMLDTSLRWYVEKLDWQQAANVEYSNSVNAAEPNNVSLGVVATLPNDHAIQLSYRDFSHYKEDLSKKSTYASYSLAAFSGLTEIGVAYESSTQSEFSFNVSWMFRF